MSKKANEISKINCSGCLLAQFILELEIQVSEQKKSSKGYRSESGYPLSSAPAGGDIEDYGRDQHKTAHHVLQVRVHAHQVHA